MASLRLLAGITGITAAAAAGGWAELSRRAGDHPDPPAVRQAPFVVRRVRGDVPPAVTPRRLAAAAGRLAEHPIPPRWAELLHAVRLWGPAVGFRPPAGGPAGPALRPLTDAPAAAAGFGRPMLLPTPHGVVFRPASAADDQGEQHWGQTLAALAEAGVPADTPLAGVGDGRTVRDAVFGHLADFSWELPEHEWAAVALAGYLPPAAGWANKHGRRYTFDELLGRLCDRPDGAGGCHGAHVCYAVAVLLRAADEHPILSAAARRRGVERLQREADRLVAAQRPDGGWDPERVYPPGPDSPPPVPAGRLVLTGHSLEWMALAPPEVAVPDRVVQAAAGFVAADLLAADPPRLDRLFCPYTHAAHGLALWHPAAAVARP